MELIYRKYIAASITGIVYSCILAITYPNFLNGHFYDSDIPHYIGNMIVYMLYVMSVCYTYGVLASSISEQIGQFLARKSRDNRLKLLVSLSLHLIFGLVLLWVSLPAAFLFFLIDLFLIRLVKKYTLRNMLFSIGAVIVIWLVLLVMLHFYS